ncbi:MAG: ParB/RepB/Spo0J family partition protein [Treponema sp.]|nr:ParB/RepB/Spo0J family partition protein [Treponema sp.]
MAIKHGLGKGLAALLPANQVSANQVSAEQALAKQPPAEHVPLGQTSSEADAVFPARGSNASGGDQQGQRGEFFIPLEHVIANPNQPRKTFDEAELAELTDSIRQQGVIQPILVEDAGDGTFMIIAGERRTRAARLAGLTEIPAILRRYSEEKRMVVALIENIQRANLNAIEEAAAYRQLMELENLSQEEAAAKVGKNRATVANALRLLKLPPPMQESIRKGELSSGHARAVLSVADPREQELLFHDILAKGLSVREAEKRAAVLGEDGKKRGSTAKSEKPAASSRPPELLSMEEKFIKHLGTKVVINGALDKGTIAIDYYSMDDLDRLYEILGGR